MNTAGWNAMIHFEQIEIDGVSRMSAYLHYGMVSPFRLAREASADGAEKFLDELLIWRELAYAFCYYRDHLESSDALPAWRSRRLEKLLSIHNLGSP